MKKQILTILILTTSGILLTGCFNKTQQQSHNQTTTHKQQIVNKLYTPEKAYQDFFKLEIQSYVDTLKKILTYKYYKETDKISINGHIKNQNNISFTLIGDISTKGDTEKLNSETTINGEINLIENTNNQKNTLNLTIDQLKLKSFNTQALYINLKDFNIKGNSNIGNIINQYLPIIKSNLNKWIKIELPKSGNNNQLHLNIQKLSEDISNIYTAFTKNPIFKTTKEEKINNGKKYYIKLNGENLYKIIKTFNKSSLSKLLGINNNIDRNTFLKNIEKLNKNFTGYFLTYKDGTYKFIIESKDGVIEFGKSTQGKYLKININNPTSDLKTLTFNFKPNKIEFNGDFVNGNLTFNLTLSENNGKAKFGLKLEISFKEQFKLSVNIDSIYEKINKVEISEPKNAILFEKLLNQIMQPSGNIPMEQNNKIEK